MARLIWHSRGERFYEQGVDRGVLYVDSSLGVAWPGLISVQESPSGGEPKAYYIDGYKYLHISSKEEFVATIEAFSSPPEFAPCDGLSSIMNGLFATQQPRKQFNFCYRTMVGNDVKRSVGYKLHLVYNALAAPSERANSTLGESVDPSSFSWQIETRPPAIVGRKPTAHFIIDSRSTPPMLMSRIEDILYGTESWSARLPQPQEIIDLFSLVYLPMKVVETEPGVFELLEVDPMDQRTVRQSTAPAAPLPGEEPILWLDTSGGNFAVPKLVTGG